MHGIFGRVEPTQFFVTPQCAPAVAVSDNAEQSFMGGVDVLRLHGRALLRDLCIFAGLS
ncbi:MAG TPA: hypothetical protein VGN46_19930 [Luteibacter sp.]|jgi:hypothetical protein|uniref:hypothetical protein n=1 Tax=Luteibacter sp. TaxID=1886636 RepID=UPI002F422B68